MLMIQFGALEVCTLEGLRWKSQPRLTPRDAKSTPKRETAWSDHISGWASPKSAAQGLCLDKLSLGGNGAWKRTGLRGGLGADRRAWRGEVMMHKT